MIGEIAVVQSQEIQTVIPLTCTKGHLQQICEVISSILGSCPAVIGGDDGPSPSAWDRQESSQGL